jgi:site-specific DNA-methyltransferase (adenine-specific)
MNPYFTNQNFTLYNQDCIKVMQSLPSNSIDMVFADPPYFLSGGSFTCKNGQMVSVKKGDWDIAETLQEQFDFQKIWIEQARRILKPNGTIWISGTYHSIYQCGFALQLLNFKILNDIAWYKPNAAPNLSGRYFTASHETLIWAIKDKNEKHTFNYSDMKNKSYKEDVFKNEGKQMRSVWSIPTTPKREKLSGNHPTQKPLSLIERIIVASTNEGDTVFDPFSGSCTTGVACYLLNRKFIGAELEKEYVDLGIARLNEVQNKHKEDLLYSSQININV